MVPPLCRAAHTPQQVSVLFHSSGCRGLSAQATTYASPPPASSRRNSNQSLLRRPIIRPSACPALAARWPVPVGPSRRRDQDQELMDRGNEPSQSKQDPAWQAEPSTSLPPRRRHGHAGPPRTDTPDAAAPDHPRTLIPTILPSTARLMPWQDSLRLAAAALDSQPASHSTATACSRPCSRPAAAAPSPTSPPAASAMTRGLPPEAQIIWMDDQNASSRKANVV